MDMLDPIARPPQTTYDIFLEPEIAALTSLPYPDGPLMLALLDAGLRKGEARRLQGQHVIPEPIPGQLRIVSSKGGKQRIIPLTIRLSQALTELDRCRGDRPQRLLLVHAARRRTRSDATGSPARPASSSGGNAASKTPASGTATRT